MPEISRFFGIEVYLLPNDHPPPHVHVSLREYGASVEIDSGKVRSGTIPARQLRVLRKWMAKNRDALLEAERRMLAAQLPDKISPPPRAAPKRSRSERDAEDDGALCRRARGRMVRGATPYPKILYVEHAGRPRERFVRVFFAYGRVREFSANYLGQSVPIFDGSAIQVEQGIEISAPRLSSDSAGRLLRRGRLRW